MKYLIMLDVNLMTCKEIIDFIYFLIFFK